MRFNFVSEYGDGLGLAMRCREEGHAARMWIHDKEALEVGEGLVDKVGDIEDLVVDASVEDDVFIFDTSGFGLVADGLLKQGYAVVGGSVIADRLEKDRKYGTEVMKLAGIETPETFSFTSWEKAVAFVEEYDDRLVFKPSKKLGQEAASHVSYDKTDLLEMLASLQDSIGIDKPEFDLQQFVKGVPVSSEAWFDGWDFVPSLGNHTLERKELMNENLGPSGGCTGNIVWSCDHEACALCEAGILQMKRFLRDHNYVGMIDLNAIVNADGVFGLEWTPRFGYDAGPTLFYGLLQNEVSETLAAFARRDKVALKRLSLKSGIAAGLRVSVAPWPSEGFTAQAEIPVRGITDEDIHENYWFNVRSGDRTTKLRTAGAWGIVACLLGYGSSVRSAFKAPYELAEKLKLPDKQYRTDLIDQFKNDLAKLEDFVPNGIYAHVG